MRQNVFEYVRSRGQAARSDITHALAISAGSATTLTADLIASGFLREQASAPRENGRGRPRVALEVIPDTRHVIGIKLAFQRHTAVLTDFAGNVVADAALPASDHRRSSAQLIEEVSILIDRLLKISGQTLVAVHAIGVGLPGIMDHESGVVAWSSMLAERDVALGAGLSAHFGRPVRLDNDANMLTLAELWFGEGRAMSDFAVVTIASGVGMGLVVDNALYRGAHGMGLELGHTKVHLDGALCRCGQRGCLEAYLADYALIREASTVLDPLSDPPLPPSEMMALLYARAHAGDEAARAIFRRAGRYLSLGLSNVIQLFDPKQIILSGEQMPYDYLYADHVLEEMAEMTLTEGRKPCTVAIHAWGDLVWARGASALALSTLTEQLLSTEAAQA
jgi:predicted NBD/HSP70 family sugar kinase